MTSRAATADRPPWFERWPDLKAEERRFDGRGLPWTEDLESRPGYLKVHSEVQFNGRSLAIEVLYPSEYPELPPCVGSDEIVLGRHQHPFSGNFCLLEQPIDSWVPGSWRAADLIKCQLGKLLRDPEAGPDAVRSNEAPMPEPATAFYQYTPRTVVLVPGNLAAPTGEGGELELGQFSAGRFVLTRVDDSLADSRVVETLEPKGSIRGKWKRIDKRPPAGPSGEELLPWLREHHRGLVRDEPPPPPPRKPRRQRLEPPPLQIVGLVFPEERDAEGNERDSWLFLEGLGDKRAAVLGLGSLGGEVAVQLARAGIGALDIADFDRFEANNSEARHGLRSFEPDVRWQQREGERIYRESGRRVAYIGDWHTHPFAAPTPSAQDRGAARLIAGEASFRSPTPLSAIVGSRWRDQIRGTGPELAVFVWRSKEFAQMSITLCDLGDLLPATR